MSYTDQEQGDPDKSQIKDTGSSQGDEDAQTTQTPQGEGGESEEKAEAFDETLLEIKGTEPKEVQKVVKKEDEGQKQVNTWYNRIVNEDTDDDGEVFTLDHPKIPRWVKQSIENKLGLEKVVQTPNFSRNEIKKEILDDVKFDNLVSKIPKLPQSKQLQVQKLFQRYTERGMNKLHALEEALEIMEIEVATENRVLNRQLRSAPPDGDPVMKRKKKEKEEMSQSAMELGKKLGITDEDRKKYAEQVKKMRGQQ